MVELDEERLEHWVELPVAVLVREVLLEVDIADTAISTRVDEQVEAFGGNLLMSLRDTKVSPTGCCNKYHSLCVSCAIVYPERRTYPIVSGFACTTSAISEASIQDSFL